MTKPSLLRAGWMQVKKYLAPVMAAALMYGGTHQIISVLKYPLTDLTLRMVNATLLQALGNALPLPNIYGGVPWQYHTKVAAIGVVVVVIGMFLGLWVNARSQRRSAP